jgi:hypothetical protein
MRDYSFRPLARSSGIVVSQLDGELLVYDLDDHRSFCVNPAAASILELCDGNRSIQTIARELSLDVDLVVFGLDHLGEARLLVKALPEAVTSSGLTRRQLVKRVGIAAALAVPAITVFAVPATAASLICAGFVVPTLTCVPGNTTDLSDDGCPCTANNQCAGVCPVTGPRFCLGGNTGPFCAPGNTLDLSIDCCPCTSNNECAGVCPVSIPGYPAGTRFCLT